MIRPNFLVIGAQRAATTWLHHCLREHPEIFVPEIKEVHFFDKNHEKGFEYYTSYFKDAAAFKAIGEVTPNYLNKDVCAERIHHYMPDTKLVVILRNPIERAYSDFKKFFAENNLCFEDAIEKYPSILKRGRYYDMLSQYLRFFDKRQLLLLLYEDLHLNNREFLKSVYQFLQVDISFIPSWLNRTSNASNNPEFTSLLRTLPFRYLLAFIKMTPLDGFLRKLFLNKHRSISESISVDTRTRLIGYYSEPNRKLQEFWGRDLSQWK